jgi:flagellar biogenesis protein FliO
VLGSLAIVVGVFLLLAWLLKRGLPRSAAMLPREAFDVLGRAPLAKGHYVHLVRCGNKLLLISVMPGGAETLTEITDALEVDRIAGICQQSRPSSATAGFRQVFEQLGHTSPAARSPRGKSSDHLDLSAFAGIAAGRRGDADG